MNKQSIFVVPIWRHICNVLCQLWFRNVYFVFDLFQYESSVAVRDRVAFACMFLSDAQVKQYKAHISTLLSCIFCVKSLYTISWWLALQVHDYVAFFSDLIHLWLQLPRYIDKLTNEMKEAGNLEGILLTGLTKDGVDLMESYVDLTGDIQTASFCMLKVHREVMKSSVSLWEGHSFHTKYDWPSN